MDGNSCFVDVRARHEPITRRTSEHSVQPVESIYFARQWRCIHGVFVPASAGAGSSGSSSGAPFFARARKIKSLLNNAAFVA